MLPLQAGTRDFCGEALCGVAAAEADLYRAGGTFKDLLGEAEPCCGFDAPVVRSPDL